MAELEETEHGDEGRAREWMTRARARAARSGLDRRRLRVRALAAGVAGDRPARRLPVEGSARRARAVRRGDRERGQGAADARRAPPVRAPDATAPRSPTGRGGTGGAATSRSRPRAARTPPLAPTIDKVIPLVHVPDDPGPDPEPHTEPETEPPAEAAARRLAEAARAVQVTDCRRAASPLPCQGRPQPISQAPEFAAIAQPVEHVIRNDGVGGSNPFCGTIQRPDYAFQINRPHRAAEATTLRRGRLTEIRDQRRACRDECRRQ